jgi:Secretion system C-terminal sorting domain
LSSYIFSPVDGLVSIHALVAIDGRIYFGGDFDMSVGMAMGHGLGAFNGSADAVDVMASVNGVVNDLDSFGASQLVAGGNFTMSVGTEVNYVMVTDLVNAVPEHEGNNGRVEVWPNPTVDHLFFAQLNTRSKSTRVSIMDGTGRTVQNGVYTSLATGVDVRALSSGTYTVLIEQGNERRSARFVKR